MGLPIFFSSLLVLVVAALLSGCIYVFYKRKENRIKRKIATVYSSLEETTPWQEGATISIRVLPQKFDLVADYEVQR